LKTRFWNSKVITDVDGDAALALDLHPVRARVAALALGLHLPSKIDRTAKQQQLFGQRGLAGVRMRDDCERAPSRHFFGKRRQRDSAAMAVSDMVRACDKETRQDQGYLIFMHLHLLRR
jgi:hypothetical protein